MRWNSKIKPEIDRGQIRMITKFLLLPKNINGEIRWLETVSLAQEACPMHDPTTGSSWIQWDDLYWID